MFFTYIMADRKDGTLYIGQTDDLLRRVWEHKDGIGSRFTREHGCTKLVWFESHATRLSAFNRERMMKEWNRGWTVGAIERANPDWDDLSLNMAEAEIYAPARMFEAYDLSALG